VQAHLNGVSVTPLEPMMASDSVRYIDRITNIQRLRAKTPEWRSLPSNWACCACR
jgi:hypothetical protein